MTQKKVITISSIVVGVVLIAFWIYKWNSSTPANPDMRASESGTTENEGIISISGKGSTEDMESLIELLSDIMEPPRNISGKDDSEWIEFKSSEGGFSVLLTNTPAKSTSESMLTHFNLVSGNFGYAISYADLKEGEKNANAILDGVSPIKGIKQLSQSNISINGFPGREVVSEITGTGWMLRRQWFVVNDRSYFLSVQFPKREGATNVHEADKFLDSFKILGQESDVSAQNQ